MSTGPNVPAQQDSFLSALQVLKRDCYVICLFCNHQNRTTPYVQSFGASLGLPVQGLSPEQEMPSRRETLLDNSNRRDFGVSAAAMREKEQAGSMQGEGDSHQYASASRISLPASKTAKGKQ
jgi:hypothetical protein